jgi:hypothetical protein
MVQEASLNPEKYRHDLEVVRNTAGQVIKDFGMAGIKIEFSGNPETAYQELIAQVTPALEQLYKNNQTGFMALLYRIDVDESKVRNITRHFQGAEFFTQLTELVIEREFIKVLIRKLFSANNG